MRVGIYRTEFTFQKTRDIESIMKVPILGSQKKDKNKPKQAEGKKNKILLEINGVENRIQEKKSIKNFFEKTKNPPARLTTNLKEKINKSTISG